MPNGQADFPNERATAARWPQAGGRDGRGSGIFRQKGEGRQKQASVFQSAALDFQSAALDFQSAALEIQKQALKTLSQAMHARPAGPESEESFTNVLLPLPFALPLQA